MGQASVQGLSYLLPQQSVVTASGSGPSSSVAANSASDVSAGDVLDLGGDTVVAGTYHATIAQVSFVVRLQQVRAQLGDSENGVQVSGQQLEFSFLGEVRSEEFARFSQKSSQTANSLGRSERETYIETSQRIAARFQLSLTMSGAALEGFTGSTDALKASGRAWDQFMKLTNLALDQSDDTANQILDLFNGFFKTTDGINGDAFTEFVNELFGMLKGLGGPAAETTQTGKTGETEQTSTATSTQVQINIQMSFSFEATTVQGQVQQSDPITLDLDGDGIELTSYTDGATFDITGKGKAVNTAFVTGGDAFLAIDRDGNGLIDSGKELFGDQNGAANGYEELHRLDSNSDGLIDSRDRDFDKLVLFKNSDENATSKMQSLGGAGIIGISLSYRNTRAAAAGGNSLGQVGAYVRADGTKGFAADTVLNYLA